MDSVPLLPPVIKKIHQLFQFGCVSCEAVVCVRSSSYIAAIVNQIMTTMHVSFVMVVLNRLDICPKKDVLVSLLHGKTQG